MQSKRRAHFPQAGLAVLLIALGRLSSSTAQEPIVDESVVIAEKDRLVAVVAEHSFKQSLTDKRAFHLTHADKIPNVAPDGDAHHVAGARGGAYLEVLPDTRRTHDDQLIRGENFAPEAGTLPTLHFRVHFRTPGRYYVWVRAYSTGTEDNGLHVGMDGEWPASGQRLQWCELGSRRATTSWSPCPP